MSYYVVVVVREYHNKERSLQKKGAFFSSSSSLFCTSVYASTWKWIHCGYVVYCTVYLRRIICEVIHYSGMKT